MIITILVCTKMALYGLFTPGRQEANLFNYDINICVKFIFIYTRKIAALRAAFSSSCGGLQPSAAMVGPLGPNNSALRAHLKMFEIHLENFAEIHLENFPNGF